MLIDIITIKDKQVDYSAWWQLCDFSVFLFVFALSSFAPKAFVLYIVLL